jgi:hypothetical protein
MRTARHVATTQALMSHANASVTLDQVRPGRHARETQSAIEHRASDSVPIRSHAVDEYRCNCLNVKGWALNSAVECHLHTVEVIGSNPIAPTIF